MNWKRIHFNFKTRTQYFASDIGKGQIMSVQPNGKTHILKGCYVNGYRTASISALDKHGARIMPAKTFTFANLILKTFKPQKRKRVVAVHIKNNKKDNSVKGLKWMTRSEMGVEKHKQGRLSNPPTFGSSKLSKKQIKEIKRKYSKGINTKRIADKFKVSKMQVLRIVRGESWSEILPKLSRKKMAKLSTPLPIVRKIKKALKVNGINQKQIAEKFKVGETTVSRIKRGIYYDYV